MRNALTRLLTILFKIDTPDTHEVIRTMEKNMRNWIEDAHGRPTDVYCGCVIAVEQIIRKGAHDLFNDKAWIVAGVIMAEFLRRKFAPPNTPANEDWVTSVQSKLEAQIRGSASELLRGNTLSVAQHLVTNLAIEHGLAPPRAMSE